VSFLSCKHSFSAVVAVADDAIESERAGIGKEKAWSENESETENETETENVNVNVNE
jgi:hypothetical protein